MKTVTCPICTHCKKPISLGERGVIVHGDLNMVNVTCPNGDQGGIVGSNFPNPVAEGLILDAKLLRDVVRKMPYHLACLVGVIERSFEEDWREEGDFSRLLVTRP